MKKIDLVAKFAVSLLVVFVLMACNRNNEGEEMITVNGKAAIELVMDANGGEQTVTVFSKAPWVAQSAVWITVDPINGAVNQDVPITISVGANDTGEERSGGVVFSLATEEFAEVVVVQPKK